MSRSRRTSLGRRRGGNRRRVRSARLSGSGLRAGNQRQHERGCMWLSDRQGFSAAHTQLGGEWCRGEHINSAEWTCLIAISHYLLYYDNCIGAAADTFIVSDICCGLL